nr:hypothetical protein [Tanacetum cinerariifolium]
MMRLVKHGLEECEFDNTCNNEKSLSEVQLKHEKEDKLVMVVVKGCGMVVRKIDNELVKEMQKLDWWFEQDIDDEGEKDEKDKDGDEEDKQKGQGTRTVLLVGYQDKEEDGVRFCFLAKEQLKSWNRTTDLT